MTSALIHDAARRPPLRWWPGVVCATLLSLVRFGVPAVAPGFEGFRVALLGGFLGTLGVLAWWAFFSRAPRTERWGALLLMVVALAATWRLNHASMGLMWCVACGVPVLCLALVAWAGATRRLADAPRRAALVATFVLASGGWTLVRMEGLSGDHEFEFAWRWSASAEERLLARPADDPRGRAAVSAEPGAAPPFADWPGFRGPGRDGIVPGVTIDLDWSRSPPVELWRRPVGPGWSSFAVAGDLLYTQEQRGDDEVVACHDALTGEPVWRHRDAARFFESMGGAGPRATPTLHGGLVYSIGATGILNALVAVDGAVVWSRDLVADTGSKVPIWGFASSPLVVGDLVIVAAGGQLVAYDLVSGVPRWFGVDGGASYSSPQRSTIDGVTQILLLSDAGIASVSRDGARLWDHAWSGTSLVQPALTAEGDVLISAGEGKGLRRLGVAHGSDGWKVEERWESYRLKPNFSDLVVHAGHAFGFDGSLLACIDLADGARRWKGGRYGHGQLVLLREQGVLLVLSDEGELALVAADPERYVELARFPALTGKTWNHPALVGDLLLVRNGQEMAAFRLSSNGD